MTSYRPSLRETRDKWLLGRDPDKSWCHRHTSVKFSWSKPMDPWSERQHTRMLPPMSREPCAATKKVLYQCDGDAIYCPVSRRLQAMLRTFHLVLVDMCDQLAVTGFLDCSYQINSQLSKLLKTTGDTDPIPRSKIHPRRSNTTKFFQALRPQSQVIVRLRLKHSEQRLMIYSTSL